MAVKIKDFLKGLADKTGLKNQDFDAVLAASALNDIELPDEFDKTFNEQFLTRERAKNDPAIVSEIQKIINRNAFTTFDEKITGFLPMLDAEDQEKIKSTKETYEKYDLLKAGIKKVLQKGGGKATAEEIRKVEDEWSAKLRQAEESHTAEITKFKNEQTNLIVDSLVKQKILAHNFGEAFIPLKESISDLTVNKVRSQYKLVLDKGQVAVMQDVEGNLRDVFENNDKLTIDKLLERELKQFTAVSSGKGGGGNSKGGSPNPPEPKDYSKMTLAEMRAHQAMLNGTGE